MPGDGIPDETPKNPLVLPVQVCLCTLNAPNATIKLPAQTIRLRLQLDMTLPERFNW